MSVIARPVYQGDFGAGNIVNLIGMKQQKDIANRGLDLKEYEVKLNEKYNNSLLELNRMATVAKSQNDTAQAEVYKSQADQLKSEHLDYMSLSVEDRQKKIMQSVRALEADTVIKNQDSAIKSLQVQNQGLVNMAAMQNDIETQAFKRSEAYLKATGDAGFADSMGQAYSAVMSAQTPEERSELMKSYKDLVLKGTELSQRYQDRQFENKMSLKRVGGYTAEETAQMEKDTAARVAAAAQTGGYVEARRIRGGYGPGGKPGVFGGTYYVDKTEAEKLGFSNAEWNAAGAQTAKESVNAQLKDKSMFNGVTNNSKSAKPAKPADYPDATWDEKLQSWTVKKDGIRYKVVGK